MNKLNTIIFDLDDTLLDTSQILVPQAELSACEAMVHAGLNCKTDECCKTRNQLLNKYTGLELFKNIVKLYNPQTEPNLQLQIAQTGFSLFYNPIIPKTLPLRDGAKDILNYLKQRQYQMFLVTAGIPETQKKKITALNISEYFIECLYVDVRSENKTAAFKKILTFANVTAPECLSVGNKFSDEILSALQIGMQACWVPYGEHSNDSDNDNSYSNYYKALSLNELVNVCKL